MEEEEECVKPLRASDCLSRHDRKSSLEIFRGLFSVRRRLKSASPRGVCHRIPPKESGPFSPCCGATHVAACLCAKVRSDKIANMSRKRFWIKRFVVRYFWAGPLVGFILALLFGTGVIPSYFDYSLKNLSAALDKTKVKKELLERIQTIHNEISSTIPKYLTLRDRLPLPGESYLVRNEYIVVKMKLVSLVGEYNRLEVDVGGLENSPPRFYSLPLPPLAPRNLKLEEIQDGGVLVFSCDPPLQDPLVVDVMEELRGLFKIKGHEYPSDKSWADPNVAIFDLGKLGYKLYVVPGTNGPGTNAYPMDRSTFKL